MVICFLTTDDILGSAGLKDMTKGLKGVTGVLRGVG